MRNSLAQRNDGVDNADGLSVVQDVRGTHSKKTGNWASAMT